MFWTFSRSGAQIKLAIMTLRAVFLASCGRSRSGVGTSGSTSSSTTTSTGASTARPPRSACPLPSHWGQRGRGAVPGGMRWSTWRTTRPTQRSTRLTTRRSTSRPTQRTEVRAGAATRGWRHIECQTATVFDEALQIWLCAAPQMAVRTALRMRTRMRAGPKRWSWRLRALLCLAAFGHLA